MEETQEILLSSLSSSGVSLPSDASSIKGLEPDALVSICVQSLRLLVPSESSFASLPASLPSSTAERFKLCEEIASGLKSLGYPSDLGFRQFLYPSDDDSYKVVRFVAEKLSASSENKEAIKGDNDSEKSHDTTTDSSCAALQKPEEVAEQVGDTQTHQARLARSFDALEVHADGLHQGCAISRQLDEPADAALLRSKCQEESPNREKALEDHSGESPNSIRDLAINQESTTQRDNKCVADLLQRLAFLHEQSSELRHKLETMKSKERMLMELLQGKELEYQYLESDYKLVKAALETLDNQHSHGLHIDELNERVEAREHDLKELEAQCGALKQTLEDKSTGLGPLRTVQNSEMQEKLIHLREIEQQTEAIISEISRREVEHSELLLVLEKQPKAPSRKSYIQRITEITKNSWKQDADINRILQDTRELQMESNTIQERLHRTYAVVDETVFRDAKNDPVRRQVYRLLTSIHDSFQQISEKTLATDRARREAAEHEAKLAAISSRALDSDKLQADIDSIRKENEFLEQKLHHK